MTGPVKVMARPELPIDGVTLILGNDIAGDKVRVNPVLFSQPCRNDNDVISQENPGVFPSCAITRSMSEKESKKEVGVHQEGLGLEDTFLVTEFEKNPLSESVSEKMSCRGNKPSEDRTMNDKHSPQLSRGGAYSGAGK